MPYHYTRVRSTFHVVMNASYGTGAKKLVVGMYATDAEARRAQQLIRTVVNSPRLVRVEEVFMPHD